MNKVKRLYAYLCTLSLVSCTVNPICLAMNCNVSETNKDDINQNSIFAPHNLFKKSLIHLKITDDIKEFRENSKVQQKDRVMNFALNYVYEYAHKKPGDEILPDSGDLNLCEFTDVNEAVNACISKFENDRQLNSYVLAFILYRLTEYINLPSVIKIEPYGNKTGFHTDMFTLWEDATDDKWNLTAYKDLREMSNYKLPFTVRYRVYDYWWALHGPAAEYFLVLPNDKQKVNFKDLITIKFNQFLERFCNTKIWDTVPLSTMSTILSDIRHNNDISYNKSELQKKLKEELQNGNVPHEGFVLGIFETIQKAKVKK